MLTIYYLTPNHLLISYIIIKLITIFFKNNNTFPFLKLIALILQFFILMIYLEVLELNFCNLNKNTKKNILEREKKEMNPINEGLDSNIISNNDDDDINGYDDNEKKC